MSIVPITGRSPNALSGRNPGIPGRLSGLRNTVYGCLCAVLLPWSTRTYSGGGGLISAREMHHNWVKALDSGVAGLLGRDLSRMRVELNVIPAVSTEAERIFSGERSLALNTLMAERASLGDDVIEGLEFLKSWALQALLNGPGSQIEKVERMLSELETSAAEMK
ncbi:hypothetical protein FN846DRAFT_892932 [Sphaerosporella brunnea]|uniref:HAT C-terminal dimerisation domain-containing protein n=1 Tax=Sphaerosporella brunnea TaxID=1250544 RepID=A0A5J5EP28_9PEZI|nr:hypothetical protein FN846DRAFT_892932 [Sphaerosporella brunnea]